MEKMEFSVNKEYFDKPRHVKNTTRKIRVVFLSESIAFS